MSRLPDPFTLPTPPGPTESAEFHRDALLARSPSAFLPLSVAERAAIDGWRAGLRRVPAGQHVIDEHTRSNHLFTLYAGWAFRFKTLSDGRRQILNFLLPGDLMGLQDEFAEGRTHGVEVASDAVLGVYPREPLWGFFNAQPRIGYAITWLAAREEKMLDDALVSAGRRTATERVAMLMLHLFNRAERVGLTQGRRLAMPFNQQHFADALGLSLVHTNKTLRKLQRAGLFTLEGGLLELIEPKALARLSDYHEQPVRPVPLL